MLNYIYYIFYVVNVDDCSWKFYNLRSKDLPAFTILHIGDIGKHIFRGLCCTYRFSWSKSWFIVSSAYTETLWLKLSHSQIPRAAPLAVTVICINISDVNFVDYWVKFLYNLHAKPTTVSDVSSHWTFTDSVLNRIMILLCVCFILINDLFIVGIICVSSKTQLFCSDGWWWWMRAEIYWHCSTWQLQQLQWYQNSYQTEWMFLNIEIVLLRWSLN